MCGIFGWNFKKNANTPWAQREALASILAVANSLRGDQSWGFYAMDRQGGTRIERRVGDIAKANGIAQLGVLPVVMAHTRFATTGTISKENQHPFSVGKILLAHNGVVFNHDDLNHKYDRDCKVDSMHFAYHLSEGKPFEDIEGYGSLEWIDTDKPKAVRLCRMSGGVLAAFGIYGGKKGKQQIGTVWSSDRDHLKNALGAARIDCFPYEPFEEGQVYEVVDGKLFIMTKIPKLELAEDRWPQSSRWVRSQYATSGGYCGTSDRKSTTKTYFTVNGQLCRWDDEIEGWVDINDRPCNPHGANTRTIDLTPRGLADRTGGQSTVVGVADEEEDENASGVPSRRYYEESLVACADRHGLTPMEGGLYYLAEGGGMVSREELEDLLEAETRDRLNGTDTEEDTFERIMREQIKE